LKAEKVIFLGFWAAAAMIPAHSVGGVPCDPVEYAELKDSTKEELNVLYCRSASKARFNEKMTEHAKERINLALAYGRSIKEPQQEMVQRTEDAVSCLKLMNSTSRMLEKNFKSKPSC
jgi:hypothetical protein